MPPLPHHSPEHDPLLSRYVLQSQNLASQSPVIEKDGITYFSTRSTLNESYQAIPENMMTYIITITSLLVIAIIIVWTWKRQLPLSLMIISPFIIIASVLSGFIMRPVTQIYTYEGLEALNEYASRALENNKPVNISSSILLNRGAGTQNDDTKEHVHSHDDSENRDVYYCSEISDTCLTFHLTDDELSDVSGLTDYDRSFQPSYIATEVISKNDIKDYVLSDDEHHAGREIAVEQPITVIDALSEEDEEMFLVLTDYVEDVVGIRPDTSAFGYALEGVDEHFCAVDVDTGCLSMRLKSSRSNDGWGKVFEFEMISRAQADYYMENVKPRRLERALDQRE